MNETPLPTAIKQTLDRVDEGLKTVLQQMAAGGLSDDREDQLIDKVVHGYSIIQEVTETLLEQGRRTEAHLDALLQFLLTQREAQSRPVRPWWNPRAWTWPQRLSYGAGIVVLLSVVGWGGYRLWPSPTYKQFALAIHPILVDDWGTLSKPTQDKIRRAYSALHLPAPATAKQNGGK